MRKILHLCLCGLVTEGMTYQDNLLPKYHKRLGYEVKMITSRWCFDDKGNAVLFDETEYVNADGIEVLRLPIVNGKPFSFRLRRYAGLYESIDAYSPDILFIHGCQFMDADIVARYLKWHSKVLAFVDNHADFSNSATNWASRVLLHRCLWRNRAKKLLPYVHKWYGVLPARIDFLHDIYGIPREDISLLEMGIDDDYVSSSTSAESVEGARRELALVPEDFVLVTGGKIDAAKMETLDLMRAFSKIKKEHLKLVIFGEVEAFLRDEFEKLLAEDSRILFIGWKTAADIYRYLGAADLVCFPGRHSVLWEQTVGLGIPAVFKYWDGTTHVDVGGNCKFLKDTSEKGIYDMLVTLLCDDGIEYKKMKVVAGGRARERFSYLKIAEKSIEK